MCQIFNVAYVVALTPEVDKIHAVNSNVDDRKLDFVDADSERVYMSFQRRLTNREVKEICQPDETGLLTTALYYYVA